MNITGILLLVVAVILLGTRLPSFMNRLGMSKADKLVFVISAFSLLVLVWFIMQALVKFI